MATSHAFSNSASFGGDDPIERELKFLARHDIPTHLTSKIPDMVIDHFENCGLLYYTNAPRRIITSQRDTECCALRKMGATLRVRGTYDQSGQIVRPDICIKIEKSETHASGALDRFEFEVPQRYFNGQDLDALRRKYSDSSRLNRVLDFIEANESEIRPLFEIDVLRRRSVIEIPANYLGGTQEKDKCFFGELICDQVTTVLPLGGINPHIRSVTMPEIECEILRKNCDYDENPRRDKAISRNLNVDEVITGLFMIKDMIEAAAPHMLVFNPNLSKADRGYNFAREMTACAMDRSKQFPGTEGQRRRLLELFSPTSLSCATSRLAPVA